MGCVLSSRCKSDANPHIFDVLNVDDSGQERNPGQIEVTDTDLILHHLIVGKEPIRWPLNCLRRYGFDAELFSFESGRRCPTGPGIYAFRCRKSELLFNLLQECIHRAGQEERNGAQSDATGGVAGVNYHRPNPPGTDHNRPRVLGDPNLDLRENGQARVSQLTAVSVTDRNPREERPGRMGRSERSPRLLLSDWAGPEQHSARMYTASNVPPAPNSLASLGQRTPRFTSLQPDYINTDTSRLPVKIPPWSNDYENHVTPFKTGRGMKWMTSTLSSQEDLFDDEPQAGAQPRPDRGQSDVQYADLQLLRCDSPANDSVEGLPNDEDEGEEDVFPLEIMNPPYCKVNGIADETNPLYGHVGVNATNDELESDTTKLVYINVPTSVSQAVASATTCSVIPTSPVCAGGGGGRALTLPVISESSDQIFPGVARGHSETSSSSTAEYANIGSPRRARLGPTCRSISNGTERRATIGCSVASREQPPVTMAATAKLQPLSPSAGKFPPGNSRLQPLPSSVVPLPLSTLKPPQSPLLPNGATSPVVSKVNQKITYVQLDLQTTPTSGSVPGGRCHPGGFSIVPGNGSNSPRVLCRATSVASAAAASSEGYATIDFQRTLALNSKCADEGVRKTRHNSHIEMVALN